MKLLLTLSLMLPLLASLILARAQVPIPGSVWLLGSGLVGLALWGRRFFKR